MKIIYIGLVLLTFSLAQPTVAGEFALQANDNPFLNGELNPKYSGELTALQGVVIDIQSTKQNFPVYKLNVGMKDIKDIWVTSIAPLPAGGINIGDAIIFKGYISIARELDESGDLEKIINGQTLLMALQSLRAQ